MNTRTNPDVAEGRDRLDRKAEAHHHRVVEFGSSFGIQRENGNEARSRWHPLRQRLAPGITARERPTAALKNRRTAAV